MIQGCLSFFYKIKPYPKAEKRKKKLQLFSLLAVRLSKMLRAGAAGLLLFFIC
jgi:hypothetical protein